MPIPRHAKLNDLAAMRIAELESQGYHVTHEDVVMLNAIAWEMRGVGIDPVGLSRGNPVDVGGVHLWPYTIQASYAIDDIESKGLDYDDQAYTVAYIMAHGRDKCAFDAGVDQAKVKAWAKRLTCTVGELVVAINEVNRQTEDYAKVKVPESSNESISDLVVMLQQTFGETAEYWEREVSASYATRLIMQEYASKSGKAHPRAVELTRAFGYACGLIKERSVQRGEN